MQCLNVKCFCFAVERTFNELKSEMLERPINISDDVPQLAKDQRKALEAKINYIYQEYLNDGDVDEYSLKRVKESSLKNHLPVIEKIALAIFSTRQRKLLEPLPKV